MTCKTLWRIERRGAASRRPLLRNTKMGNTKAHQEWVAANTTRVVMNLNHNIDKDVLEKLSQVPSKQGYIKELIRADIAKDK